MSTYSVSDDDIQDPTWTGFFGSQLRGAREHRCLSIEQAAQRAGMDPNRWQAIEGGKEATRFERSLLARGLGITDPDGMAPLIILCRSIFG